MKPLAPGALIATCLSLAFAAEAKPRLEISIAQEKEIVDGAHKARLVPAQAAAPGDLVQYTLSYANKGDEVARDAIIDDPIPKGTTYIANSAAGAGAEVTFSSDGGKTFAAPVKLTYELRLPSGAVEKRIATPSDYTHVRFTIRQVPPGATGSVAFRVRVN